MKIFAVVDINGGIVLNTVVGDNIETVTQVVGPCIEVTEGTGNANIGYIWDGITFTPPPAE